jgi:hypothetical protein
VARAEESDFRRSEPTLHLGIRTVLDARPTAPARFLVQTLLLAHSWAAWARSAPLEVIVLGTLPRPVDERLRELEVQLTSSRQHPLDPISRTANKLLGLRASADGPILLVDNDVCFLGDVSALDGRNVRASVSNRARVSDAQWDHIAAATRLRPIALEWNPPLDEFDALETGRAPRARDKLYLNAGVVWVREPAVFEPLWASHISSIAQAFDGHALSTTWVRGSDQAGFATAVADHGGFDLLPPAYNSQPAHFKLGSSQPPKILHLCKLGVKERLPLSRTLTKFWAKRIIRPITRVGSRTQAEQQRLVDEALTVRDRLLRLCAEADLDAFDFLARQARSGGRWAEPGLDSPPA